MEELQSKLDNEEISFEDTKLELEKITPKNREIYNYSGKIININAIGNRWAEPYAVATIITEQQNIRSININDCKIKNFNIEKDDISCIIGRKISILDANDNQINTNKLKIAFNLNTTRIK